MRDELQHQKNLQKTLEQVISLLRKQELEKNLVHKQQQPRRDIVESLLEKQHLAKLQKKLEQLHPADIAFILENLPLEPRMVVWKLVSTERDGAVLLEVSEAVRKTLIADMDNSEILDAAQHLDADEIADLVPALPKDIAFELLTSLNSEDRAEVQSALTFPEGTVGALMDFDMVTVREDVTFDVVIRYLRRLKELPEHTDQLFVTDRTGILKGLLPLKYLLIKEGNTVVKEAMIQKLISFYTDDTAREAVQAFQRYDFISAPVINIHNQLVGRLSVDNVVDYINETSQKEILNQVGLSDEEDLFAPLWTSAKHRWPWIALNLMTAFIASRVINVFESSIEQLAALAILMPIIAGIGGNSGTQTMTLIIRGLALDQINSHNWLHLLLKEVGVSLMNGILWGSLVGLFSYLLYEQILLSLVMMVAMILNLLVASFAGVLIPLILYKIGRDPAMGSSVMLTALTDSMGFFIFLGLATVILL